MANWVAINLRFRGQRAWDARFDGGASARFDREAGLRTPAGVRGERAAIGRIFSP